MQGWHCCAMRNKHNVVLCGAACQRQGTWHRGNEAFRSRDTSGSRPSGRYLWRMVTARAGRGDDGTTDLLGRRRVSKGSVAIDALGDLDEATSSIGLARAHVGEIDSAAAALLEQVQRDLYEAMAEVAIPVSRAGGHRIDDARLDWLTTTCEKVDLATPTPTQFVLPGATIVGAQLDVARTVVRRAERTVVRMLDASDSDPGADLPTNRLLGAYLNRLSTLLYLLARGADHATGRAPEFARRARLS